MKHQCLYINTIHSDNYYNFSRSDSRQHSPDQMILLNIGADDPDPAEWVPRIADRLEGPARDMFDRAQIEAQDLRNCHD
jgi:hypothetical protein